MSSAFALSARLRPTPSSLPRSRFWEGRKLWGRVFEKCRSMARISLSCLDMNAELYHAVIRHLKSCPIALKQHLRGQFDTSEFSGARLACEAPPSCLPPVSRGVRTRVDGLRSEATTQHHSQAAHLILSLCRTPPINSSTRPPTTHHTAPHHTSHHTTLYHTGYHCTIQQEACT